MQTLCILGPRSKAGKHLVQAFLAEGFRIKTMIHGPSDYPLTHPALEVLRGDATCEADLRTLLSGCTLAVNCLGRPINQVPVYSTVTELLLRLAPETGLGRLFTVTNAALIVPGDQAGFAHQGMAWLMRSLFGDFMADRQAEYRLLAASNIDWTLIRLPVLLQGTTSWPFRASTDRLPGFTVHTTQLPRFILGALTTDTWHRTTPFLAG